MARPGAHMRPGPSPCARAAGNTDLSGRCGTPKPSPWRGRWPAKRVGRGVTTAIRSSIIIDERSLWGHLFSLLRRQLPLKGKPFGEPLNSATNQYLPPHPQKGPGLSPGAFAVCAMQTLFGIIGPRNPDPLPVCIRKSLQTPIRGGRLKRSRTGVRGIDPLARRRAMAQMPRQEEISA